MKNYGSLPEAMADLKQRGYDADFETETTCLYCSDLDMRLNPDAFNVDEIYRFEGVCGPGDHSVVYAISSTTGVKGVFVDGAGADASSCPVRSKLVDFSLTTQIHFHKK